MSFLPIYSDFHRGDLENDFGFGIRAGILGYFERVHLIIASVDGRSDFGRLEKCYSELWVMLAQAGCLKYMIWTSSLPIYSDFHRGDLENGFDFGLRAGILGYFERVHRWTK